MWTRQVAQKLAERGWLPDLIMCSDSSRTQQTLSTMADAIAAFGAVDTHFRGSLYTVAALDGQLRSHLQVPSTPGSTDSSARYSCHARILMEVGHKLHRII